MKWRSTLAGLVLLGSMSIAQASAVDVRYTVSGSAGAWLYDFSFTNNIGGGNEIYSVGVRLNVLNHSPGFPLGWSIGSPGGANWFNNGGSNTNYNNTWVTCLTASCPINFVAPEADINPGETTSGFKVLDIGATALTNVSWYALAFGGVATAPGCSFNCLPQFRNPGFEGLAAVTVPLPPALWLLGSAFGLMAAIRRKVSR